MNEIYKDIQGILALSDIHPADCIKINNLIIELTKENKQLKDNWNKLKDYIVKEYYMYLPLEASTRSITILIDKMHELEQGSGS